MKITMHSVDNTSRLIRMGTSSFSSPDWVGPFYPAGTKSDQFLRYYATQFNTVEVDATYYSLPTERMVDRWIEETPADFLIAAKFPRAIVHAGESAKPDAARILMPDQTYPIRDRFLEVMGRLGERLGPLLIQFPYFSKREFRDREEFYVRLDNFLADLPSGPRYAVEIRNRAWLSTSFVELCRSHKVAVVLVDHAWMPHGDEVMKRLDPLTSDFTYIRLLGDRKEIERVTKTWDKEVIDHSERLRRWARLLFDLAAEQVPALVYINNHYAGHAPATLRRLREMFENEIKNRPSWQS
jgi:uncharacterized protein YecE (DUF72 family)